MTVKRLFSAVLVLLFIFGLGFAAVPTGRVSSVMEEILDTVNAVVKDFPAIGDVTVKVVPLPPLVYAMTEGGEVSINERFASDERRLQLSMDHDVAVGFHPWLGHCSAAQFLAYHESAHLVDNSENAVAHNMLAARFGDGYQLHGVLSGYSFYREDTPEAGAIQPTEALAEAFAATHCNGGNPVERQLAHMLTWASGKKHFSELGESS